MRKNQRRNKRMSVAANRAMHLGSVVMMLFVMVLVNIMAETRCGQTSKIIGERSRELKGLEEECRRAENKWSKVRDGGNLDRVLLGLGMQMKYAKPNQIVYMDKAGSPRPGQIAVARDMQRRGKGKVVQQQYRRRR